MIPSEHRWIVRDIAFCFGFFTRVPIPESLAISEGRLGRAIWAAPLIGLAIGAVGGFVYAFTSLIGLSGSVVAALAIISMLVMTGCLHEDGLADTADGFAGGRTRGHKLDIMRDSRIGTFGAAALFLSLLLRWGTITDLQSPVNVFCALVASQAASRALLPAFMHMLPPARQDGLAAGAGEVSAETAAAAVAIGALALLIFLGPAGLLAALPCLAIAFFAFRHLCRVQIGGQSGDTLGALQQIAEIVVLVIAAAVFN